MIKKINLIVCFVLISFLAAAQSAELVYKNNVNSTVTIETEIGQGSGFFVGTNLIATNYHVIEGATEAFCYTNSSAAKYEIEGYVAVDKEVDLVILKVKGVNKPAIKMSSSTPTPGQKVYVLGSPKGLEATISEGIVSGLRNWNGRKLIQISAPISHGSSGGPVLNANGLLVGISVGALEDGQNLNSAIPKSNLDLLLGFKKSYATPLSSLAGSFENKTASKSSGNTSKLKSVKIGEQVWSAENLNTDRFANGDYIPEAKSGEEWKRAGDYGQPAWCHYENSFANGNVYGKLYNWYAVADPRGLCPVGWHVPKDSEWAMLEYYYGGSNYAGGKLISTGFTGLLAGTRNYTNGKFVTIDQFSYWWSSTQYSSAEAIGVIVGVGYNDISRVPGIKENGVSIRCIKD